MKRKLSLLYLIIVMVLVASCNKKEKIESKKEVIAAQVGAAKSLDPQGTNDKRSLEVIVQVYDTLVEVDKNMELKDGLAENWEYITPTKIRFKLKDGIKFHNEEPLKVEDVIFSLNRVKNSKIVGAIGESIESVEKVDDKTFDINTKYPTKTLLKFLADPGASIVSEKAVNESGNSFGQNPVGTGPFILEEWVTGDKIVLKSNKEHTFKKPNIDKLVFRSISEATNRVIGLETGEVDIAYAVSPIDAEQVLKNSKLELMTIDPLAIEFIGFNMKDSKLKDENLRKAIIYALNSDEILGTVLGTYAESINSPLAKNMFGYTENRAKYSQDIDKAKEYLDKVENKEDLNLSITIHSNSDSMQISQIIQAQLKDIGINLTINPLEWGTFISETSNGKHQLFHLGKTSPTGDGEEALTVFNEKFIGAAGNRFFYSNPKVNELLTLAKEEIDDKKREAYYQEVCQIIQEDGVMAISFTRKVIAGVNKNISNFEPHPSGMHRFYKVDKEVK
ncbi:MAG: ABC transporter substrate-binding protein [Cetobacterium sp.]